MFNKHIFDELKKNKAVIFDFSKIYKNIEDKIKIAKDNKNILLSTDYRGKNSEGINIISNGFINY